MIKQEMIEVSQRIIDDITKEVETKIEEKLSDNDSLDKIEIYSPIKCYELPKDQSSPLTEIETSGLLYTGNPFRATPEGKYRIFTKKIEGDSEISTDKNINLPVINIIVKYDSDDKVFKVVEIKDFNL